MRGDPRSTARWQRVRLRVLREETVCWLCGEADFVAVARHPRSKSVDHVQALANGGLLTARANLRLAHFGCNARKAAGEVGPPPRSEAW